jgi:hypothetical protein
MAERAISPVRPVVTRLLNRRANEGHGQSPNAGGPGSTHSDLPARAGALGFHLT